MDNPGKLPSVFILCDGPITRPEESYRCGVSECDRETSQM